MYFGCGRQSARRPSFAKYEPASAEAPHGRESCKNLTKWPPNSPADQVLPVLPFHRPLCAPRSLLCTAGRLEDHNSLGCHVETDLIIANYKRLFCLRMGRSRFSRQPATLRARSHEVGLSSALRKECLTIGAVALLVPLALTRSFRCTWLR
jgi:hypothetical protein